MTPYAQRQFEMANEAACELLGDPKRSPDEPLMALAQCFVSLNNMRARGEIVDPETDTQAP